jgi:hypothetical protein
LGSARFAQKVADLTKIDPDKKLEHEMQLRLQYLSRIPFRAIITTNYNNLLDGDANFSDAEAGAGGAGTQPRSNVTYPLRDGNLNPHHNFEEILRPKVRGAGGGLRYGVDDVLKRVDHEQDEAHDSLPQTVRGI